MNRELLQRQALEALMQNNGGTLCLDTGFGKSKVSIDYLKQGKFKNILITSPRTNLKDNWAKELEKWGIYKWEDFGADNTEYDIQCGDRINITIENIQTCYKWTKEQLQNFDLIIADEAHTYFGTGNYDRLIKLAHELKISIVGLTGTPELHKEDKRLFYEQYCPVVFSYFRSEKDSIINKTKYIIFEHTLSDLFKTTGGTKKKPFMVGEATQYDYLTNALKQAQMGMLRVGSENWFDDAREWGWGGQGTPEQKAAAIKYLNAIKYRKEFLWNLTSTAKIARQLADIILADESNKVLIFSELTKQCDRISPTTIHSHNHPDTNKERLRLFNEGSLREAASSKSLQLGLNLAKVNFAIFESYNGSSTGAKQSQGRLQRLPTDEIAHVIIIKVVGTQYDTWFEGFTKLFHLTPENSVTIKSIEEFKQLIN